MRRNRLLALLITAMLMLNAAGCMTAQTGNFNLSINNSLDEPDDVGTRTTENPDGTPAQATETPGQAGQLNMNPGEPTLTPLFPVLQDDPLDPNDDDPAALLDPSPSLTPPIDATPASSPSPSLSPSPSPAYIVKDVSDKAAYLNAGSANLRKGPGTNFDIITELKRNAELTVTGQSGEWYRVKADGKTGFLLAEFVKIGSAPTPTPTFKVDSIDNKAAYLNTGSANLRKGPGTNFDIITELKRNAELTVTGQSGEWYRVKADGETGYLLAEFVKLGSLATPSPSPSPSPSASPSASPTSSPSTDASYSAKANAAFPSTGSYSAEDLYLLAQLVHEEAQGTSLEAQMAVANTLYNRLKSSKYPNTVEGVVYQKNQYTPTVKSGFLDVVPGSRSVEAVTEIFVYGNTFLPESIHFFRASRLGTDWGDKREYYATYGGNMFFISYY